MNNHEHWHRLLDALIKAVEANPLGLGLYLTGALWMTLINLWRSREAYQDFKGDDQKIQPAERIMYLFCWICPYCIIGAFTGVMNPPGYAWLFLSVMLLYGLMGNKGVELLASLKGGKVEYEREIKETGSITKT